MKKLFVILALAGLTACGKEQITDLGRPGFAPEPFFSRVRYFYDGRRPATDTVWTIKIVGDSMQAVFKRLDGYIYEQTPTSLDIGRMWEKIR
jgi:hypothetical protein